MPSVWLSDATLRASPLLGPGISVPTEFQCLAYSALYASLSAVNFQTSARESALRFGLCVMMKSLSGRIGSEEAVMADSSSAAPSEKYRLLIMRQAVAWAWGGKGVRVMEGWEESFEVRVARARRMGGWGFTRPSSVRMPMRRGLVVVVMGWGTLLVAGVCRKGEGLGLLFVWCFLSMGLEQVRARKARVFDR